LRNKLGTLYFGPGWIPGASSGADEFPIPPTSTDSTTKYDPRVPSGFVSSLTLQCCPACVHRTHRTHRTRTPHTTCRVSWYILGQFGWALVLLTVAIDRYIARRPHSDRTQTHSQGCNLTPDSLRRSATHLCFRPTSPGLCSTSAASATGKAPPCLRIGA
jgi:hypothetical protein